MHLDDKINMKERRANKEKWIEGEKTTTKNKKSRELLGNKKNGKKE